MYKVCRRDNDVVLEGPREGHEYLLELPGVTVMDDGSTLCKLFPGDRFKITPDEIQAVIAQHRTGRDVIVLGFSGYSVLNAARCEALHIRLGEYEAACVGMFAASINGVRTKVYNPDVRIIYGSSDTGVDRVIEDVATRINCPLIGISCPEYLWWVNAEKGPIICVTPDKQEYCDTYIQGLDILFAANGGPVSYDMDIRAATHFAKRVIVVDVLRTLGARIQGFDKDNNVLDAAAAIQERLALISAGDEWVQRENDPYEAMKDRLVTRVISYARQLVSPTRAYGILS